MLRPLSDRILIKPLENSDLSKGGIYTGQPTTTFIAGKARAVQTMAGEVLAIGAGKPDKNGRKRPPDVPVGSFICFSDTCGQRQTVDGEDFIFIREGDVIGFLERPCDVEMIYEG